MHVLARSLLFYKAFMQKLFQSSVSENVPSWWWKGLVERPGKGGSQCCRPRNCTRALFPHKRYLKCDRICRLIGFAWGLCGIAWLCMSEGQTLGMAAKQPTKPLFFWNEFLEDTVVWKLMADEDKPRSFEWRNESIWVIWVFQKFSDLERLFCCAT